jgi:protein-S-isoprenylcysteine O-methyltransferase Ste14
VFYRRARLEDRVLSERFGAEWLDYVRQAKFLIPWIW